MLTINLNQLNLSDLAKLVKFMFETPNTGSMNPVFKAMIMNAGKEESRKELVNVGFWEHGYVLNTFDDIASGKYA